MERAAHTPVLLHEVITYLDPRPGDFIIDGTVDGGGHAKAIREMIGPRGMFLGVDWDQAMIARHAAHAGPGARYIQGNYADLPEILVREKLGKADGLLLDLGFSSEQLEASGRGFSFGDEATNEPLLMTYSDERAPVAELLRGIKEEELARIIYEYGGERLSRRIARVIIARGKESPIVTAGELAAAVRSAVPSNYERGRIDPATRTFQALRIHANDELGNLKRILEHLPGVLTPGGRAVIISFHSLEDRIVKHLFQNLAKAKILTVITKKPIGATQEEITQNPRSRSAKLRAAILSST